MIDRYDTDITTNLGFLFALSGRYLCRVFRLSRFPVDGLYVCQQSKGIAGDNLSFCDQTTISLVSSTLGWSLIHHTYVHMHMDPCIHTHSLTRTHKYTYIYGMATNRNHTAKGTHDNTPKLWIG